MTGKLSIVFGLFLALGIFAPVGIAQTTGFTYQGSLNSSGVVANGNHDFEFALFDAASGGAQLGSTITQSSVVVTNGIFAVSLDFGSQFPGAGRFLEIRVRPSGVGGFITLAPRQQITSSPYSVKSLNSDTATIATNATNATNATTAATATNALSLGGVAASGYLQTNGNGSGLTNLNASSITSGTLANARLGEIPTANIADNAVTAPKIASGQVVKTLNGLTDSVTLAAGSNISITPAGNTLTIASTGGGVSGSGTTNTIPLWSAATALGNSVITQSAAGNVGIGTSSPIYRLHVLSPNDAVRGETTGSGFAVAGVVNSIFNSTAGVYGQSNAGRGVWGVSSAGLGVEGSSSSGSGVYASSSSGIALRTQGTSWFSGDTTPLSSGSTGGGTGIGLGSVPTSGYIFAYDYGSGTPKNMVLNQYGGSVGIGIVDPLRTLHVNGRARIGSIPPEASVATVCFNAVGDLLNCNASSLRFKNNVNTYFDGLNLLRQLRPISYTWKDGGAYDIGLGAEDVAKVAPFFASRDKDGVVEGVRYERLNMLLINAVNQQQTQIERQQQQIDALTRLVCASNKDADICKEQ